MALAILALATSLVGPRLLAPRATTNDGLGDVISRARRSAIESGQAVTLSVESSGDWNVVHPARGDVILLRGHLPPARESMHLDVSPNGACLLHEGGPWDPARCTRGGGRSP